MGTWFRLDLDDGMPVLAGHADGRNMVAKVDTGGLTVIFNEPTVRAWKMLEGLPVETDRVRGIGGAVMLRRATLRTVGICDYLGLDVLCHLATEPGDEFGDVYTNATVGAQLLRSFVVVFDYPHHRAAVVAREKWPVDPRVPR